MDNYNNLPDWVVFLHGFPEEHNNLLFDWLSAFKRPKPSSPVYIPLEQRIFVSRPVPMSFMAKLGLKDELQSNASELGWDGVVTASACCAEFIVSRQAITRRSIDFWQNILQQFHRNEFKLLAQEVAQQVEARRTEDESAVKKFEPMIPSQKEPEKHETDSAIGPMSYGTVDTEGSNLFKAFETVWHVLFGRPAQDDNIMRHVDASKKYWCKWFEDQPNSPCQGFFGKGHACRGNQRSPCCWGARCNNPALAAATMNQLQDGESCCR